MKNTATRSLIAVLLACGSFAAATSATAAPRRGESDSTYQRELAVCGHNQQDRAACIREAGAARQAAAQGGLSSAPDYRANALARCSLQPPMERRACEQRVTGAGDSAVQGSVMGGGLIRETVTPIPVVQQPMYDAQPMRAPPPVIAPMPAPMPMR